MRSSVLLLAVVAAAVLVLAAAPSSARPVVRLSERTRSWVNNAPSSAASFGMPGDSCTFNHLQGTCMSTKSCSARGGNSTSIIEAQLCAGEGNFCCISQEEIAPGCGTAALARAKTWANAQLTYCQSPNGQPDPLTICSPICTRAVNPVWDPYRSDCSGLVSFAYGLPPPGHITLDYAPYKTDVSFVIPGGAAELQPGDAINSIPREHVMLFAYWNNAEKTVASFYEEPTCVGTAPYARLSTTDVKINSTDGTIALASNGMTFAPIRFYTNKEVC